MSRIVRRWIALVVSVSIAASEALAANPVSPDIRILSSVGDVGGQRIQSIPSDQVFSGNVSAAIGPWSSELIQVAQLSQSRGPSELKPPTSFIYRSNRGIRFSNTEAADKLKFTLFRALPSVLDEVGQHLGPDRKDISLDTVLTHFKNIIRENYTGGDGVSDIRDKMEARLSAQWDGMRAGVKLDDFQAVDVLGGAQGYLKDFQSKRDRFQGEARDIFSSPVRTGAAFGNLGSRVILSSLGLKPAGPEAVLALTLLHPITDDALDRGMNVGPSMARIALVLEGQKLQPANPFEEVVFALIGDIFESFRPTEHPALQQILILLHQAQLESVETQKRGADVDRAKLLELTARKGGLTALALAYVSIGSLRKDEFEFFYKAGILFQLGDDLMDVAEDKVDGTTTLWTLALASKKEFRSMMQLFFDIQECLETSSPEILSKNPLKTQLNNDLRLGFRFYLFSSLLNKDLDHLTKSVLKNLMPLSSKNIRSISFSLFKGLKKVSRDSARSKEGAEYIEFYGQVFNRHFLNGAYGRFEKHNFWRSARSTYRITDPNPWFLIVKFGDRCQDLFAYLLRPAKVGASKAFSMIRQYFFAVTMLYAYLLFPQLIRRPGLREAASIAVITGAFFFMFGIPKGPEMQSNIPWRRDLRTKLVVPFLMLGFNAGLYILDILLR